MKPRVAIGITSYRDLSEPEIGGAIYDALADNSPRIVPTKGEAGGTRAEITSRQDFADRWLTESPFERRENRGRGPLVDKGVFRIGLEWRSVGVAGGKGEVLFRPERDANGSDAISMDYAWSPRIDWAGFFDRLVDITQPSYAMLHLFTPAELAAYPPGDRFDRFDGPVTGEGSFTGWRSSLGDWHGPDKHRPEERRQYRFLPQLSWANVLGKEFAGRYDAEAIGRLGQGVRRVGDGLGFRLTNALADVEREPEAFGASREQLRQAFATDFFRR